MWVLTLTSTTLAVKGCDEVLSIVATDSARRENPPPTAISEKRMFRNVFLFSNLRSRECISPRVQVTERLGQTICKRNILAHNEFCSSVATVYITGLA